MPVSEGLAGYESASQDAHNQSVILGSACSRFAIAIKVTVNTLSDIYAISIPLVSSGIAWTRVGASRLLRDVMRFEPVGWVTLWQCVRCPRQNAVLEDIRSGIDETAIRKEFHNLSDKGVKKLYEKLIEAKLLGPDLKPASRKLNLLQFVADIRAGMSNPDIMAKYKNLSEDMFGR